MNRLDVLVDKAANRLQRMADEAATNGGVKAKLAQELADDAAFLRKLKPSLIVARAKGRAPTNQKPGAGVLAPSVVGGRTRRGPRGRQAGSRRLPNPFLVVGVAFAAGIFLAKVIDWRGHAHPRD